MYDQIREDTLFVILYSFVTAMAAMSSCYLLLRRGNAFAPNITPPVRLRRWTAAYFAFIALGHIWYMPILFLSKADDIQLCNLIGGLLDSMTCFPLSIVVMYTMLQDRWRPLWPIAVLFAPITIGMAWCVATRSDTILPWLFVYFVLVIIGIIVYMVRALKQYGRWLRENYADLENKEIWQSFAMLLVMLMSFVLYAMTEEGSIYIYLLVAISAILIICLLWRVETLSDLSINVQSNTDENTPLSRSQNKIASLLEQHCEKPQLYLQYDISISQLAMLIGVNRSYLSKHFALQGITYNTYINGLRIQHFVNLCHEVAAANQPLSVKQLAMESGFHSYSTFNAAFKQIMGTTATEWLQNISE